MYSKEVTKSSSLEYILQKNLYPDLYSNYYHKVRIEYYPPRGDAKEGWDNIDIFGWLGYPMQIKINFLCRDSILAAPLVLDLVLFMDLAQRAGMRGIQEWLSFYFKAPMQIKINFLCRDSILAAPLVLDLVLFMDLAQRAGMRGIQEWLSFYFKAPMH